MPPDDISSAGAPSPQSQTTPSSPAPTSSPAPAPSQSQPSSPNVDSGSSSADGAGDESFSFLDDVFGGPEPSSQETAPSSAPQPTPAPQPAPAQAAQPAPVQQPGQVQPQPPVTEPQGAPTQQAQAPVAQPGAQVPQFDPSDPMSLAMGLVEHQEAAIEATAQRLFTLGQKDLEALETDAPAVIPRLLAKAVVVAQQQALTQMAQIVPAMMQRQMQSMVRHAANESQFYSRWPSINKQQHGNLVIQLASIYRKMFPDHDLPTMVENLGPMVMARASIPFAPQAQPGAVPVQGNGRVTVVPAANGSRPPAAFQPAAPGSVTQQGQPVEDPFGFLGQ